MINKDLYNNKNIYNFIDTSINILLNNPQYNNIRVTEEYFLFYYIKSDFFSNWMSLYNFDIDLDFLGFPLIQKNTRHAIEAFLDLFNLYKDKEGYMKVLKYYGANKKDCHLGKYKESLHNDGFTIQSKSNIAEKNGMTKEDLEDFINTATVANYYIHPNIFIKIINQDERDEKEKILKNLLNINLKLLDYSYMIIKAKFFNGVQPELACPFCPYYQCKNCENCYKDDLNLFLSIIDDYLLIDYTFQPKQLICQGIMYN